MDELLITLDNIAGNAATRAALSCAEGSSLAACRAPSGAAPPTPGATQTCGVFAAEPLVPSLGSAFLLVLHTLKHTGAHSRRAHARCAAPRLPGAHAPNGSAAAPRPRPPDGRAAAAPDRSGSAGAHAAPVGAQWAAAGHAHGAPEPQQDSGGGSGGGGLQRWASDHRNTLYGQARSAALERQYQHRRQICVQQT